MSKFILSRTIMIFIVIILLIPFLVVDGTLAVHNLQDKDDILGGWVWEWRNNTGFTVQECPGGEGKVTVTYENGNRTLAFTGKVRYANGKFGEQFTKSGTWEYLGQDPNYQNRRRYSFKWSNDTDLVTMSDSGNIIVGSNGNGLGKCRVQGTK